MNEWHWGIWFLGVLMGGLVGWIAGLFLGRRSGEMYARSLVRAQRKAPRPPMSFSVPADKVEWTQHAQGQLTGFQITDLKCAPFYQRGSVAPTFPSYGRWTVSWDTWDGESPF